MVRSKRPAFDRDLFHGSLFGFGSEGSRHAGQNFAFASRVRLSEAPLGTAGDPWLFPAQKCAILRAMKSPDPNSAALYFADPRDPVEWIGKRALSSSDHDPRGRKRYIVRQADDAGEAFFSDDEWRNYAQKLAARGKHDGQSSTSIFENLTRLELGLLSYVIQPSPDFRHKLGLGKPLGLGTVRLGRLGLFLIHRRQRYGDDSLDAKRFHYAWKAAGMPPAAWPARYRHEKLAAEADPALSAAPPPKDLAAEFRAHMNSLDPSILNAIEHLGHFDAARQPVKYLVPSQARKGLPPIAGRPGDELPSVQD